MVCVETILGMSSHRFPGARVVASDPTVMGYPTEGNFGWLAVFQSHALGLACTKNRLER